MRRLTDSKLGDYLGCPVRSFPEACRTPAIETTVASAQRPAAANFSDGSATPVESRVRHFRPLLKPARGLDAETLRHPVTNFSGSRYIESAHEDVVALDKDSSVVEIAAAPDGRAACALRLRDSIASSFQGRARPTDRERCRLLSEPSHDVSFLQAAAASGAIGVAGQDLTRSVPGFNATPIDGLSALPACGSPKSVAANLTHPTR